MKLVALVCVLLLSVSGIAKAGWERTTESTIRLDGDIDADSYEQFMDVAKAGYSKVILRSFGGVPMTALRIAEEIAKHDAEIEIDSYCFSSCANYLALAGKHLTVPCESLLGWHGTPSEETEEDIKNNHRALDYPPELTAIYQEWVNTFREREQRFYTKINVKHALLADSVSIPLSENLRPEATFTFDKETAGISLSRSAVLWIPGPDVLAMYGVPTEGFCRRYDHADIQYLLLKKGMSKIRFSSGGPDKASTPEI